MRVGIVPVKAIRPRRINLGQLFGRLARWPRSDFLELHKRVVWHGRETWSCDISKSVSGNHRNDIVLFLLIAQNATDLLFRLSDFGLSFGFSLRDPVL